MSNKNKNKQGVVYSTDPDFQYRTGESEEVNSVPPAKQDLRIWLEKNHRGGKEASVIRNFIGSETERETLCKLIKTKCGTGGSVKDGEIIIQGDQRKKIADLLTALRYKFKLAGA